MNNTNLTINEEKYEGDSNYTTESNFFNDEYDEQYRNVQCWNCEKCFAAGNSWEKVKCPNCQKVNIVPKESNEKVNEWERILEMKLIKVTCPSCKKNIYCKRESEYVVCNYCNTIMSIIKNVPLRPETYEHKFSESVLVPEEKNFTSYKTQTQNNNNIQSKTNYNNINNKADKYKPLLQTIRDNQIGYMKFYKDNK